MNLKVLDKKLKHIMKLLPDVLVYHYFDWEFNTQNNELPERFIEFDFPNGIKRVFWYDDLHDGITHQVGDTIRELYYPQDKAREIWFMTVKALVLRHLEIPAMEDWEEEAEELGIEIEDLEYYQKWESAKEFSDLSNVVSLHSSEAITAVNSILFQQINEELITNKNKGKRKKAKGFKS